MSRSNLAIRDGTSQRDRLPEALKEGYVQIDERSLEDQLNLLYKFAGTINFYELSTNQLLSLEDPVGWHSFLPSPEEIPAFVKNIPKDLENISTQSSGQMQPHLALLISFLKLFDYAKKDINKINKRYLDFYYQKILQFSTKKPVPDKVLLYFELAKNVSNHLLPAKTILKAGKNENGVEQFFETSKEIVINRSKIRQVSTLFVDKKDQSRIYFAPVANSADGNGEAFEKNQTYFKPFGESQKPKPTGSRNMLPAEIGFAIASPILLLGGGGRTICIKIKCLPSTQFVNSFSFSDALSDPFLIELSSGKQWIKPSSFKGSINSIPAETTGENNENIPAYSSTLEFIINLQPALEPVAPPELDEGPCLLNTQWPIVRIILNPDSTIYRYGILKHLMINTIKLDITVDGLREFIVQNEQGLLDLNKPFLPFGNNPDLGSTLFIGSREVFRKKLTTLSLDLVWHELPNSELSIHYLGYISVFQIREALKKGHTDYSDSDADEVAKCILSEAFRSKSSLMATTCRLSFEKLKLSKAPEPETIRDEIVKKIGELFNNQSFRTTFDLLYNDTWFPILDKGETAVRPIFNPNKDISKGNEMPNSDPDSTPEPPISALSPIKIELLKTESTVEIDNFDVVPFESPINRYSPSTKDSFLRMVLKGPESPIRAFGHKEFTNKYTEVAIKKGNQTATETDFFPNPPYTPAIKSLSINYSSSIEFQMGQVEHNTFFHIEAFGIKKWKSGDDTFLFPQYNEEGYLLIGLENLRPPSKINLLFQLEEGIGSNSNYPGAEDLNWQYLASEEWLNIESPQLVADSTQYLQQSGIIELNIDNDISKNNSRMPKAFYWLSLSTRRFASGANNVLLLQSQGIEAQRIIPEADSTKIEKDNLLLAPNSIKKFQERRAAIKSINQPFSSFGGRPFENKNLFYQRVSERLRHKQRAITSWDFERLILEAFPSIFKVKCLNHTSPRHKRERGSITIIVVSNLQKRNPVNPFQPRSSTSLLERVKSYVQKLANPFVKIYVENPVFEPVRLDFQVAFKQGRDPGFYGNLLEQEISQFLSPWAFEKGKDIVFGGGIYRSELLAFVERRDYVEFVNRFFLYYEPQKAVANPDCEGIGNMTIGQDFRVLERIGHPIASMEIGRNFVIGPAKEVVFASTPRSILVSDTKHKIEIIPNDGTSCKGINSLGIGRMRIGVDFDIASLVE